MKTLEIDDFDIKIINFDQFCKKNSPSGGPKIRLTANMPPEADCVGAKRRRKFPKNLGNYQKIMKTEKRRLFQIFPKNRPHNHYLALSVENFTQ